MNKKLIAVIPIKSSLVWIYGVVLKDLKIVDTAWIFEPARKILVLITFLSHS